MGLLRPTCWKSCAEGSWLRVLGAMQRLFALLRRTGTVTDSGVWYGPCSAERHEECLTASGTRFRSLRLTIHPAPAHLSPMIICAAHVNMKNRACFGAGDVCAR